MNSHDHSIKFCKRCETNKPTSEFHKDKSRADGLNRLCGPCNTAQANDWRAKNKEHVSSSSKERNQKWRDENNERYKEYKRTYRAANGDKLRAQAMVWRAKDPDKARAACAAWGQANKGRVSAIKGRRRAAVLQATPAWGNKAAMDAIYDEAARRRAAGEDVHVDHEVPLQSDLVCGLHVEFNLQILDGIENIRKGNRFVPG